MNILLINQYAGSPLHGMEYRPYYLGRQWAEMGHRVTVVAASYSHLRQCQPTVNGRVTDEVIGGVRYIWLKTPSYSANGVRRAVNMLAFVKALYQTRRRLVNQFQPEAVIASSTHPLDIFPAYHMAQRAGAKLVFEVHDLWPLSVIEIGNISPWHPFVMLLQQAENFAYRNADCVISMLPNAKQHMREHGMQESKYAHIPNGISVGEWQVTDGDGCQDQLQAIAELKDQGMFVVGYTGSIGRANALDALVEAARLLCHEPIAVVLIGDGVEKEQLERNARALGLTNTVFLRSVPKQSMPVILNAMDGLYMGLKKTPLYRFGISPNKMMDYMMAGKPIIFAGESANDPVAESGCGISCAAEDPQSIASSILNLARRASSELVAMGQRGREYVRREHDYSVLAQRFVEAIR